MDKLYDQINNKNLDESYKNILKDQMTQVDDMKNKLQRIKEVYLKGNQNEKNETQI